jgi:glycogen synthase
VNKIIKVESDYIFEISWEVCNKVGGIYTVVKSKASLMNKNCKNYFLIGPYFENNAKLQLEHHEPPEYLKKAFKDMQSIGIKCYFGKWNIESEPKCILIDSKELLKQKNEIKKNLWEKFGIDSLYAGWDFEEPMVWSYGIGLLLEKIKKYIEKTDHEAKISAHFHEWMSGFGLLYLKDKKIKIGTVFTTHATILGRTICGNNTNLYDMLNNLNPEYEARRFNVIEKFTTEKACAKNSDVFTTVSEITAIESEIILERKPDIILMNGLDIKQFPTLEETSIKHVDNKELIKEFLSYYFYPYYTFDLDENLIFYIVGRYEYRNKGLDILTKALGKLNEKLKLEGSKKTISVFYWIPGDAKDIRKEILENKTFYRHIRNYILRHSEKLLKNVIKNVLSQKEIFNENDIFSKEFIKDNKKHVSKFKRTGLPPLSTHYLGNEENDPILKGFKENGLNNSKEDKVKVILYPVYLNGVDGLIDLRYYDCLVGCHLGIFPSYYEPWGYTPLESVALGVPAITTDLAGFGKFMEKEEKTNKSGIYVLKRYNKNEEDVINNFVKILYNYVQLDRHERMENKINAKLLSELANWNELVNNYFKAHNLALKKKGY